MAQDSSTKPIVQFMIGGAQKCGTTALAHYLRQHPDIGLPEHKEAHVFDAPGFDESSTVSAINARFSRLYRKRPSPRLLGDATPISLLYPRAIERIARYNPDMRWILLFRDPVTRALSHYAMQRRRGIERLPLLMAVFAERMRLRRSLAGRDHDANYRRYSYTLRSRYADQLDILFKHFDRGQVLLLRSEDLRSKPETIVSQVCAFIGTASMPKDATYPPIFQGNYSRPTAWSPGILALHWRLRHETHVLSKRHGFKL